LFFNRVSPFNRFPGIILAPCRVFSGQKATHLESSDCQRCLSQCETLASTHCKNSIASLAETSTVMTVCDTARTDGAKIVHVALSIAS
jgi:hypothetical protein